MLTILFNQSAVGDSSLVEVALSTTSLASIGLIEHSPVEIFSITSSAPVSVASLAPVVVLQEISSIPWTHSEFHGPDEDELSFDTTPVGELLEFFGGRIIIAKGKLLFFTELHKYGIVNAVDGYRKLESEITMIRSVETGLYISDSRSVYFASGLNPHEWRVSGEPKLNAPAIKHSCKQDLVDPTWFGLDPVGLALLFATTKGACLGLPDGTVFCLTDKQYRMGLKYCAVESAESRVTLSYAESSLVIESYIGKIGSKAVTDNITGGFVSLTNLDGELYGANDSGIYKL